MSISHLTDDQKEAAQLIAKGNLTCREIAESIGVTYQTLWNWKQRADFAELIVTFKDQFREEVRRRGLADPDKRVEALNDRWNRMRRVIEARADHPDYAEAPGGRTGLLVRTVKKIGTTRDKEGNEKAELVEEFAVDVGLLKELREHEKQAAQELGQWVVKSDVMSDGKAMPVTIVEVIQPPPRSDDTDND